MLSKGIKEILEEEYNSDKLLEQKKRKIALILEKKKSLIEKDMHAFKKGLEKEKTRKILAAKKEYEALAKDMIATNKKETALLRKKGEKQIDAAAELYAKAITLK